MKSLRLSQPHALIMVGIPGSGKSHFAKKFSDTFNAPYVDLDSILPHAKDLQSAASLAQTQLNELLRTRQSLLIELNTASRQSRVELARIVKEAGYAPLLVWVQTDQDTARARTSRDKSRPEGYFDGQIRSFSPPHEREKPHVISGKHTYATQAKSVLMHLSNGKSSREQSSRPPERTPRHGSLKIQ